MVSTESLYDCMEQAQIHLEYFHLPATESLVLSQGGQYFMAVDVNVERDEAKHRVVLAHETGHCVKDAFYDQKSPLQCRSKQEKKADDWAVCQLLPWDELSELLCQEQIELWEIADAFSVTVEFVQKALVYYQQQGLYCPPIAP